MTEQQQLDVFTRTDRAQAVLDLYDGKWMDGAIDMDAKDFACWRYFGVEENVRGGFWPTYSDDLLSICANNVTQEYAGDWDLIAIYDLDEQRVYTSFHMSLTVNGEPDTWTIETEDDE